LLIADLEDRAAVSQVLATLRTTRIGEGAEENGLLREAPMERTISALKEYLVLISDLEVSRLRIVATSAVREAVNAAFFLDYVKETTGLAVDIISGREEARLNYIGACHAVDVEGTGIVLDIGGGSTEFTYLSMNGELYCSSVPLGAVRLTERPRLLSEILNPMRHILDHIRSVPHPALIGVGGTITTLAAVDQALRVYNPELIQGYPLSKNSVEGIMFLLAVKNSEERKKVPGLQPERSDIIVAGTTILWALLTYLQAPLITVSEADLLQGIILEMV